MHNQVVNRIEQLIERLIEQLIEQLIKQLVEQLNENLLENQNFNSIINYQSITQFQCQNSSPNFAKKRLVPVPVEISTARNEVS